MNSWPILSNEPGVVWIVSAPSGAGKTTLLAQLLACLPNVVFSVSHTTRQPRPGEQDGIEYHFVNRGHFEQMIETDQFLEWAEYNGNLYGTSYAFLRQQSDMGFDIVLDIEVVGAAQVRKKLPESRAIFILPPSFDVLATRLSARKTDSADAITNRLKVASCEVQHAKTYDFVVVNDQLGDALEQLVAIFVADRLSAHRQEPQVDRILESFRSLQ